MGIVRLLGPAAVIASSMALAGIIAGWILNKVLSQYIMGEITVWRFLVVGGLFIGFIICIVNAVERPTAIITAIIILAVLIAIPFLSSRSDKRDLKIYYDEKLAGYQAAIAADQRNLAAWEGLADTYRQIGRLEESIATYEALLTLSPDNRELAYKLKYVKEDLQEKARPPITCPSCGHQNASERTKCSQCEGNLRIGGELVKWLSSGGLKQVVTSSVIAVSIITAIGVFMTILSVPGTIAFIALALFIYISAEWLYISRHW